jgi:hypothetical protein
MPKQYIKSKKCGCIIKANSVGLNDKNMILLGGHDHLIICDICKNCEERLNALHYMWMNDNVTNKFGYGEWKECNNK